MVSMYRNRPRLAYRRRPTIARRYLPVNNMTRVRRPRYAISSFRLGMPVYTGRNSLTTAAFNRNNAATTIQRAFRQRMRNRVIARRRNAPAIRAAVRGRLNRNVMRRY